MNMSFDEWEAFEERAAIIEFDGKLSRKKSEDKALDEFFENKTKKIWKRQNRVEGEGF